MMWQDEVAILFRRNGIPATLDTVVVLDGSIREQAIPIANDLLQGMGLVVENVTVIRAATYSADRDLTFFK